MILNKLRSKRGETMVELLCGVLLISLASVIFASMVVSSTHINEKVKAQDKKFREDMTKLEKTIGSGKSSANGYSMEIKSNDGEINITVPVKVETLDSGLSVYVK